MSTAIIDVFEQDTAAPTTDSSQIPLTAEAIAILNNPDLYLVNSDSQISIDYFPFIEDYIQAVLDREKNALKVACDKNHLDLKKTRLLMNDTDSALYKECRSRMMKIFSASEIDKVRVLNEVMLLAFSSIDDILSFDGDTVVYKPWDNVSKNTLAAVAEVSQTVGRTGAINTKVRMYNKLEALSMLKEILKMTEPSQTNVQVNIGGRLFD